jgi:hypothetical protein
MCWNQYVSINTFIFGIFGLVLIAINNKYSNYKLEFFKNPYAYIFMLSVITMQLIEFILWRNLDNKIINKIASTAGFLLITIQPITSLLLLNNINLRNKLLLYYSIPASIFAIYNILTATIYTSVSPSGHLSWNWTSYKDRIIEKLIVIFYLFFLFFSLIYNKYYSSLFFLALFGIIIYYFSKDGSEGSIWCLSINSIILFFLLQVLVIMPLNEIITQ